MPKSLAAFFWKPTSGLLLLTVLGSLLSPTLVLAKDHQYILVNWEGDPGDGVLNPNPNSILHERIYGTYPDSAGQSQSPYYFSPMLFLPGKLLPPTPLDFARGIGLIARPQTAPVKTPVVSTGQSAAGQRNKRGCQHAP